MQISSYEIIDSLCMYNSMIVNEGNYLCGLFVCFTLVYTRCLGTVPPTVPPV